MNAALPVETLITDHLDLWTAALKRKSTAGRGPSSKVELYGIKKLRELILELAVRGLLVPQDPNDEPASELLKKIAAEKARLVKEGKIKADKPLPAIGIDEKPFEVPTAWRFVRLRSLSSEIGTGPFGSMIHQADYVEGGIPLINPSHMINDLIVEDACIAVGQEKSEQLSSYQLNSGDIVLARRGEVGRCAIVTDRENGWLCGTGSFYLRLPADISRRFMALFFRASSTRDYLVGNAVGTTMVNLNHGILNNLPVGLPPLAEQHRIVAKVDELMALCDQLEQQTDASLGAHQTLVETLLSALTGAADHAQFASAWQRIAGHFDTLFTTEESIDQFKQTILQLAVMGKLVPQDPNDEPASELLKKIAADKARLVSAGRGKREGSLPAVTDEEKPFELPSGWACERIGNIVSKLGSGSTPRGGKEVYVSEGIRFLRSQNIWNKGISLEDIAYISRETHEKMAGTRVVPGDVLLNITGASLGRSAIFPDQLVEANVSQHVTIIRLLLPEMARFVHLGIISPMIQKLVWGRQVGMAIEGLSKKVLEMFEFPIPPLAEQHRIVAKVDELMALCDQLKSRLSDAQTTQLHLADAFVEQAIG